MSAHIFLANNAYACRLPQQPALTYQYLLGGRAIILSYQYLYTGWQYCSSVLLHLHPSRILPFLNSKKESLQIDLRVWPEHHLWSSIHTWQRQETHLSMGCLSIRLNEYAVIKDKKVMMPIVSMSVLPNGILKHKSYTHLLAGYSYYALVVYYG